MWWAAEITLVRTGLLAGLGVYPICVWGMDGRRVPPNQRATTYRKPYFNGLSGFRCTSTYYMPVLRLPATSSCYIFLPYPHNIRGCCYFVLHLPTTPHNIRGCCHFLLHLPATSFLLHPNDVRGCCHFPPHLAIPSYNTFLLHLLLYLPTIYSYYGGRSGRYGDTLRT